MPALLSLDRTRRGPAESPAMDLLAAVQGHLEGACAPSEHWARQGERLLRRLLHARLAIRTGSRNSQGCGPDDDDDDDDDDLAAAAAALQMSLEQWHGHRSHALEWLIIALIAFDIAIHWL